MSHEQLRKVKESLLWRFQHAPDREFSGRELVEFFPESEDYVWFALGNLVGERKVGIIGGYNPSLEPHVQRFKLRPATLDECSADAASLETAPTE